MTVKKRRIKLETVNLKKSFGSNAVLDGLNLKIRENESLVILGGSGSGKSVLIKSIVGLIAPDSGKVLLDGDDITNLSYKARSNLMSRFGFLFQGGALFDSLPVWHNIAFYLIHNKYISDTEAKKIAEEKLAIVGLGKEVLNLFPSELSGGMQKRVALARAIANDPEVIFFDEPTTGLDPIMKHVIADLICKFRKEFGATTITITHDIDTVDKMASRVAMLYKGKIVWSGGTKEMNKSNNKIFSQFITGKIEGPIKIEGVSSK
ncbi:MAG: ATP-binding cassette domain-containing protein [Alphaproteobacteria bacterium]|nr:ATP-binding cassette domain-containing protein [Alphaproteobacteria bacterium]